MYNIYICTTYRYVLYKDMYFIHRYVLYIDMHCI